MGTPPAEGSDCAQHPSELGFEWAGDSPSALHSDPLRLQWLLLLSHGGYFAAAVYLNGKPLVHKTFHRYICRRKQGLAPWRSYVLRLGGVGRLPVETLRDFFPQRFNRAYS